MLFKIEFVHTNIMKFKLLITLTNSQNNLLITCAIAPPQNDTHPTNNINFIIKKELKKHVQIRHKKHILLHNEKYYNLQHYEYEMNTSRIDERNHNIPSALADRQSLMEVRQPPGMHQHPPWPRIHDAAIIPDKPTAPSFVIHTPFVQRNIDRVR